MNRDTVLYMIKNFVDIKSLVTGWMSTCKKLRRKLLEPSFYINEKFVELRKKYPVVDLYLKRDKTKQLIFNHPFKFLLECEELETNTINNACEMLRRLFPAYEHGSLAGVDYLLQTAESQKFKMDVSDNYGLLVPPQYAQFFSLCRESNIHQGGLQFIFPSFQPYCWRYQVCEGLMKFANWSDCGSDGASYFFLICDIHSPWYGRLVYYTYRRDGNFHVLPQHWSFNDFLQLLVDNEQATKMHVFGAVKVETGDDTRDIIQQPIGHFWEEPWHF